MSAPCTPARANTICCPLCGSEDIDRKDEPQGGAYCHECDHSWIDGTGREAGTAAEIQLRMAQAERHMRPLFGLLEKARQNMSICLLGRKVCARRARKLRKRGDRVVRYTLTPRGKQRYAWVPGTPVIRSTP